MCAIFLDRKIYRQFIYLLHSFGKNTSMLPVLSRVPCRRFLLFLWKTTPSPRGPQTYLYFCDGRCSPCRSVCCSLCSNVRLPCLAILSCKCHTATWNEYESTDRKIIFFTPILRCDLICYIENVTSGFRNFCKKITRSCVSSCGMV